MICQVFQQRATICLIIISLSLYPGTEPSLCADDRQTPAPGPAPLSSPGLAWLSIRWRAPHARMKPGLPPPASESRCPRAPAAGLLPRCPCPSCSGHTDWPSAAAAGASFLLTASVRAGPHAPAPGTAPRSLKGCVLAPSRPRSPELHVSACRHPRTALPLLVITCE